MTFPDILPVCVTNAIQTYRVSEWAQGYRSAGLPVRGSGVWLVVTLAHLPGQPGPWRYTHRGNGRQHPGRPSAWSGKRRPQWDRMLHAIRSGGVDVVLVWKLDRLTRGGIRSLAPVLDLLAERSVRLVSLTEHVDTTTAMGEAMVALLASVAKQSSDDTSLRVARANAALAREGRPHMGGWRPFGYEADRVTQVAIEFHAIAEGYERILAGETLYAVAQSWNARGLTTTGGRSWRGTDVGKVLAKPRYCGWRSHNGVLVAEAQWPAVVSREVWEAASALLRARAHGPRLVPARVHMLGGMLRCPCSGTLEGTTQSGRGSLAVYRCQAQGVAGTAHVTISKAKAERDATVLLWDALEGSAEAVCDGAESVVRGSSAFLDASPLILEASAARARAAEVGEMFADGSLTRAEYLRLRSRAQARAEELDAQVRALSVPVAVPSLADLRAVWPSLEPEEARSVFRAVFPSGFRVLAVGRGQYPGSRLVPI